MRPETIAGLIAWAVLVIVFAVAALGAIVAVAAIDSALQGVLP